MFVLAYKIVGYRKQAGLVKMKRGKLKFFKKETHSTRRKFAINLLTKKN